MRRRAFVIALCLAGCGRTAPETATRASATPLPSGAAASRAPDADGSVESLRLILRTDRSEYFALVYWSDGLRVEGFLGRPRRGTSLPAVIYNRAGHLNLSSLRGPEIVPLVEAGFVTAASQYRGNAGGEGREEFGGADVNDVLNLVPLLRSLPEVDPDRIGMMGWSRGGTMTLLALKQESIRGRHDIRAAVAVGATADFSKGFWGRIQMLVVSLGRIGKRNEGFQDAVRDRSAVYWPELINAPLLILHGETDGMASLEKACQLAALLERAGKTVKLVSYPGDNHALEANDAGFPEALAWFQRFLGQPGEDHSFERHRAAIVTVWSTWPR